MRVTLILLIALVFSCKKQENIPVENFVDESIVEINPNEESFAFLENKLHYYLDYFYSNDIDIFDTYNREKEQEFKIVTDSILQVFDYSKFTSDENSKLQAFKSQIKSINDKISMLYDAKGYSIGRECAHKIVDQYWQGGKDINIEVKDAKCNNDDIFNIDCKLYFYGQYTSDYYESEGVIRYNLVTDEFTFQPIYKNTNLQNYETSRGLILTEVAVFSLFDQ